MKIIKPAFIALLIVIATSQINCFSIPHLLLPKKDMQEKETGIIKYTKKILIGSRKSQFKDAVVSKVVEHFNNDSVYIKTAGLKRIKKESVKQYDVVILVNTCMAWGMDFKVKRFLRKYKNHPHIIVLTTSVDGKWMPKKRGRKFDAICSASGKNLVDKIAEDITGKIEKIFNDI